MKAWLGRPTHPLFPAVGDEAGPDSCHEEGARFGSALLFALALSLFANWAHAVAPDLPLPPMPLAAISDEELAEVSGQALIEVQKRIGNDGMNGDKGVTFTRIQIGAKIEVNANIELLELGNYPIPKGDWNVDGHSADIKATNVSFGCISCKEGEQDMVMEDPYIEFAYKNDGTANRKLVGIRFGADQVNGWLSGNLESISGEMSGKLCVIAGFVCFHGGINGPRSSGLQGESDAILGVWTEFKDVPLSMLHTLPIGNVGGKDAARNFFFGLQTEALNYPKNGNGPQDTARPGFWVNMQDGLNLGFLDGLGALFANDNAYGPIAPNHMSKEGNPGEYRVCNFLSGCFFSPWFPVFPFDPINPLFIPHYPAVAARM